MYRYESVVTEISNKIIKELEMYYLGDGIDSLPLSVVHALSKRIEHWQLLNHARVVI